MREKGLKTGTGVRTVGLGSQLTKGLCQCIEWVTRTKARDVKPGIRRLVASPKKFGSRSWFRISRRIYIVLSG